MTSCQLQSKRGNTKKISLISKESGKHSENGKMFLVGEGGGGERWVLIFSGVLTKTRQTFRTLVLKVSLPLLSTMALDF